MAEIGYVHICDYAFAGNGGKACIIGIFERILVANFPSTHPLMYVTFKLQGAPNEVFRGSRVEMGRPNGDVLAAIDLPEILAGANGGANLHLAFNNVVFQDQGRYTVKILLAGRTLSTTSLQVGRIQQSVTPPAATH